MNPSPERAEFVRRWTREIIRTSYVPLARSDIESFLAGHLDALLSAPDTDAVAAAAGELGERLVRVHFTNPAALERTLWMLGDQLPEPLDGQPTGPVRSPLVLGSVAAGYAGQLREQTLDEQEVIKRAVLQARDSAEEALRASEARFRAVFTSSALGIAIVALDGTVEEVNSPLERIFESVCEAVVGRRVFDLVDRKWLPELAENVAALAAGDVDRFQAETRCSGPDGAHIWTRLSASLVRDSDGEPDYQVVLYEDITQRHMLEEQFRRQATLDPLTGLANRTQLKTTLDQALDPTHPGRRVGLCYFDLDGFKAINDSLGHPIGDELLRAVAQRLQVMVLAEDGLAARMGGDEFVVLLKDSRGAARLVELVEQLLAAITEPVSIRGHQLTASASVGVVETAVTDTGPDELLSDADITLYRAKNDGRAQWALFDPEHNAAARRRFRLSASMPSALDDEELYIEYRPVEYVGSGNLVGVEAHVRWDHPELGELDAADFLELAEETGMITRLGIWALERVCAHAAHWRERFGDRSPVAAVGLSARQLHDPELVGDMRRILRETGLPADKLVIGVPEAALFDQHGDPVDALEIFDEMGLRLAVYDFGRDTREAARLRSLPLRAVRLSGGFLDSFAAPDGPDPLDEHLVRSLVGTAELLGLPVIANSVHTKQQANRLHRLGVHGVVGPCTGGLASAMEIEAAIIDSGLR
ncbi:MULTISPECIES: bifunctional diguanylate cyclase/phosphodiesterase [unclassified Saccharopolyspora]|uniref:putative bifunctional diguanylate cyclase/phosphodiesterase n=1 Tax=Saccharopolyspora TaxID=1835 RepID=UPI00190D66E2|nr:EAL domain-containing protein [Saccharopolyspora sp. HNM0986]MBK0867182.1 EAL domain-containing protein [Saccharopolyspora sp. HNM0986]